MAKCLVTGHKGYIGSKLFARLQSLGHEVMGIDFRLVVAARLEPAPPSVYHARSSSGTLSSESTLITGF